MLCHEDDKKWILEQLSKIPALEHADVIAGYSQLYQEAYDAETLDHKKDNKARFTANSRLRAYIELKVSQNK